MRSVAAVYAGAAAHQRQVFWLEHHRSTEHRSQLEESQIESAEWLSVDKETLRANIQGLPGASDISLPVDVNTVVEFLSR